MWEYTWVSPAIAKKRKYNRNKPIKYMEEFIEALRLRMDKQIPLTIHYTYNGGAAENTFPQHKADKNKIYKSIISVPNIKRFIERKYFYKTLLHELLHCVAWRIGVRDLISNYDDEEVIVELGSMIICFFLGLNTWDESFKYISDYMTNGKGQLVHPGRQEYIVKATQKVLAYVF